MKKLHLRSIEPRSFVRLSLYFAFPAGLWIGVFVFLISFLGGANVSLKLPWGTYSGLEAGVMGLVFIPLLVPLVAVLLGGQLWSGGKQLFENYIDFERTGMASAFIRE